MRQHTEKVLAKFKQAYEKCGDLVDDIVPFFYKVNGEWKFCYVWQFDSESEFNFIFADTILHGDFDKEEVIPSDSDIHNYSSEEIWGGEADHDQLEDVLDQILRNNPRGFEYVHINFHNPETDWSNGSSLFFISLKDMIDSQKPCVREAWLDE